jgi:hypothetical protein
VRRIVRDLRPGALDDLGLASALNALVNAFAQQTGIEVDRRLDVDTPPLTPAQGLLLYRMAQEALTNVARHADARHAQVALDRGGGRLRLTVPDDGRDREPGSARRRYPGHARARPAGRGDGDRRACGRRRDRGVLRASGRRLVTTPLKPRLVIADDHAIVRRGLTALYAEAGHARPRRADAVRDPPRPDRVGGLAEPVLPTGAHDADLPGGHARPASWGLGFSGAYPAVAFMTGLGARTLDSAWTSCARRPAP